MSTSTSSMAFRTVSSVVDSNNIHRHFMRGETLKGGQRESFPARRCWRQWAAATKNIHDMGRRKQSHFSSKVNFDVALLESPTASFDEYVENKPRFCQAILPDHGINQQLNEEEWRIHMSPIKFFFLSSRPVIDMRIRCKSGGIGYPPEVPRDTTVVIVLDTTSSKLLDSEGTMKPSDFTVCVQGTLYPDRTISSQSRLKGQMTMGLSFILPPALSLVPEGVYRGVAESVLKGLVETMKHQVNRSLLNDYSKFKREKLSSGGSSF